MNQVSHRTIVPGGVFGEQALAEFTAAYPVRPTHLVHGLAGHPLLSLEALLQLAGRMRPDTLEHNAAVGLKLGISNAETPQNGLSVHDTIERIGECGSWVLLKYIEQDPLYAQLMRDVLAEIEPVVERKTGQMIKIKGFDVPEWDVVYTDLPFRLVPGETRRVSIGGVEYQEATARGDMPYDTANLRDADLIEVVAGEWADSVFRIVEAVRGDGRTARRVPIAEESRPKEWT